MHAAILVAGLLVAPSPAPLPQPTFEPGPSATAPDDALLPPGRMPGAQRSMTSGAPREPSTMGTDAGGVRWNEVAPPQRGLTLLLPDATSGRVFMAARRYRYWQADWAIEMDGTPGWVAVQDEAEGERPEKLSAKAWDSRRGRWIILSADPSWYRPLHTHFFESDGQPRWVAVNTAGEVPRTREHASAVYDSRRDRVVLLGGFGHPERGLDDVWALELNPPRWLRLSLEGEGPPPRYGSSAIYDSTGDRVILVGGVVEDSAFAYHFISDTWALSLGDTPRWGRLETTGSPGPILATTPMLDPVTGDMLLLGVIDSTRAAIGDYRVSFGTNATWARLKSENHAPEPHAWFASFYDPAKDRFVGVTVGRAPTDRLNLFALSLRPKVSWKTLGQGHWPPGRFGAAAMVDPIGGRAFIFGGVGEPAAPFQGGRYLNDVWSMSLADPGHWAPIVSVNDPPPPRHEPVGIFDAQRDRLVVFGGWTAAEYRGSYFDDLWTLDLSGAPTWTRIVPEGEAPGGRRGHVAILDSARDRMILFGGSDSAGYLSDTWALHLGSPMRWERIASEEGPTGRWESSAVLDIARDRMVIHGGHGTERTMNDTWAMSLSEDRWSSVQSTGRAPRLTRHRAIWDPVADRMLVMGGFELDYDVVFSNGATFVFDPAPEPKWTWARIDDPEGWGSPAAAAVVNDPRRCRAVSFGGTYGIGAYSSALHILELGDAVERRAWIMATIAGNEGAQVTWQGAEGAGVPATVERKGLAGSWTPWATLVSDDQGRWTMIDATVMAGRSYGYRLVLGAGSLAVAEGEITVDMPPMRSVELLGAVPNPARGALSLAFRVAEPRPVSIELFDLSGRRLWTRSFGLAAAQMHVVRIEERLPAGVYLTRLTSGPEVMTRRIVVLP